MSDYEDRPRGGRRRRVIEFSVAGPLGPVLRTAFKDRRITTQSEMTVIRTGPSTDRDLTDLVRTLVERGLVVQSVHRLTDVPPRATDRSPGRAREGSEPCPQPVRPMQPRSTFAERVAALFTRLRMRGNREYAKEHRRVGCYGGVHDA